MSAIIMNVDDVGMNIESNRKILKLGIQGKINSISCFVEGEVMPKADVLALKENPEFRVGIHLNLTEFRTKSLNTIIKELIVGRLTAEDILNDFTKQLKLFTELYGFFPSHFDSHQHVHQLPIVRWAIVNLVKNNQDKTPEGFYIRCTDTPLVFMSRKFLFTAPRTFFKNMVFKLLGVSFKRYANSSTVFTNRYLLGTYTFVTKQRYSELLNRFMEFNFSSEDVFYCHPGCGGDDSDIIASDRGYEYEAIKNFYR
jgi:hypothetical protein